LFSAAKYCEYLAVVQQTFSKKQSPPHPDFFREIPGAQQAGAVEDIF